MPLKAKLEGEHIFAFNYDDISWDELKQQSVLMPCCESRAVLKKSKLNTLFFAHHRRGACSSLPESAEHLYIKNMISNLALELGWEVETEKESKTPDGEKWIADVYCSRGTARLVFEIQWTQQSNEKFYRRQKKYTDSGVRAAWLYRLKRSKEYWVDELPFDYQTPVFGMKLRSKEVESLYIPQFNEPLSEFIRGMLKGKLKWLPRNGDTLIAEVIPHYERCWKCKRTTGIVLGVVFKDKAGTEITFKSFNEDGIPEFLLSHDILKHLAKHEIGLVKERFSKTMGGSYISNGCFHCDALMGSFYLSEAFTEYFDRVPPAICNFEFKYNPSDVDIEAGWFFNGRLSKAVF